MERKSQGLECVHECFWHPTRHPPELDVHFIPELATCGFMITHPYLKIDLKREREQERERERESEQQVKKGARVCT